MAYSSTGIIAATDYNNFLTGANQLNTVWDVGTGNAGYGQGAIATVASTNTVTATQWATLITKLNSALTHQSGSGSGLSSPTAGSTATYLATLATSINTSYTNRNIFATQGTTVTGTVTGTVVSAAAGVAYNATIVTRSVTFASGDAARYFFNAGGQINFVITGVTNTGATARGTDASTLLLTNFASWSAFRANGSTGRTGTGGTLNANATTVGYYGITATAASTQLLCQITSTTAAYTTDIMYLYVYSSTQNISSHGDKGLTVNFQLVLNSPGHSAFNSALNVTVSHRVDIIPPETTNLTNTWGTITVA